MEVFRKKVESDQQYGSFLAQYSDPSQGSLAPNSPAPLTGPQAAPFASIHTGYDAQPSTSPINVLPRPLPYVSPTQARFGPWKHTLPRISQLDRPSDAGPARSFSGGPEASRYPVISVSQDNAGYPLTNIENDPTGLAGNQAFQTQSEQGYLTLGSNAEVIKPKKKVSRPGRGSANREADKEKQRASRAKPAELKEKAWYYQDVQEANLPTSSISAEAEQAGEQFENEQSKIMKVKKPAAPKTTRVKRGRKPAFDPVKGFPISAKAAAQLVNGGFLRKELPAAAAHAHAHGMASSNSSMMSYGAPIAADRPGLYLNQPVQPPYPTPGSQVNFVYSHQAVSVPDQRQRLHDQALIRCQPLIPTSATAENDASSPPNAEPSHAAMDGDPVELSDSSSDAPDDPKDKSFGTPSRRTSTPATQSATRGAKRKIASTAPKTKRSRLSTDGAHDEEEDETSCAGGSPAG